MSLDKQHDYDVLHLFDGPKQVWTTKEISKALGLGEMWVNRAARRLVERGVLEDVRTGRQRRPRWSKVGKG